MKEKIQVSHKPLEIRKKEYSTQFFVGIISGFTVLFVGDALSYIDKRDWLSFSVRIILSIILFIVLYTIGWKVSKKIVEVGNT